MRSRPRRAFTPPSARAARKAGLPANRRPRLRPPATTERDGARAHKARRARRRAVPGRLRLPDRLPRLRPPPRPSHPERLAFRASLSECLPAPVYRPVSAKIPLRRRQSPPPSLGAPRVCEGPTPTAARRDTRDVGARYRPVHRASAMCARVRGCDVGRRGPQAGFGASPCTGDRRGPGRPRPPH